MRKHYIVCLSEEERAQLHTLVGIMSQGVCKRGGGR